MCMSKRIKQQIRDEFRGKVFTYIDVVEWLKQNRIQKNDMPTQQEIVSYINRNPQFFVKTGDYEYNINPQWQTKEKIYIFKGC